MSEANRRAVKKYLAKGWRFTIDFYPTDQALIDHVKAQDNKARYVKELIRKDMEKQKSGEA